MGEDVSSLWCHQLTFAGEASLLGKLDEQGEVPNTACLSVMRLLIRRERPQLLEHRQWAGRATMSTVDKAAHTDRPPHVETHFLYLF